MDDTPATADIHYKLALLFDDKLKNPLAAMYHFQRYLDLKPNGSHAKDAGNFIKEDELKLVSSLSHGAFMSQEDAARLKNDNLMLRKQLDELRASRALISSDGTQPARAGSGASESQGGTSYVVQSGDTLASIARKFYRNSARWKDIERANSSKLKGPSKLKPGMILVIPK
jgi:LysM repeat protein